MNTEETMDQLIQLHIIDNLGNDQITINLGYRSKWRENSRNYMKDDKYVKRLQLDYPNPKDAIENVATDMDIITIMQYLGNRCSLKEVVDMATVLKQLRKKSTI